MDALPYTPVTLGWIALAIFLMGMSKGGFPVGSVALPLLVLTWPDRSEQAKSAVAFMLPLLCVMDVVGMFFYHRHALWKKLLPLIPGTLGGVLVGSILFVSRDAAILSVSDRGIKCAIGVLGLGFVIYNAFRKWILGHIGATNPSRITSTLFGLAAGLTSTLAHAAIPVMQMYLLPQRLSKMNFAGTTVAFFFALNLIKLIPFAMLGRIEAQNLVLGLWMLPLIPVGVASGYLIVRVMKPRHYTAFIYSLLFLVSTLLLYRAITGR